MINQTKGVSLMTNQAYYQVARYPNKTAAGKPYSPIEQIIHEEECELSAYRFFVQLRRNGTSS
jgi:hypothetical protein